MISSWIQTVSDTNKANSINKSVLLEPRPSALKTTLPAFAAERRRLRAVDVDR